MIATVCQLQLYKSQSLSLYEIARLHCVHHATVADYCKKEGLLMKKLFIKTDAEIRERRKWLKKLNYSFEQICRMQPIESEEIEHENDKPDFSDIITKKPLLCCAWNKLNIGS